MKNGQVKIKRNYITGTIRLSSDNWENLFIEAERWEDKNYYIIRPMYSSINYKCNLKMKQAPSQLEQRLIK